MSTEIERRFLVDDLPADLPPGTELRQGYVALDGTVAVRVRHDGQGFVLTVKGGSGLARTEVELALDSTRFAELWVLCGARRIRKVRHRIAHGESVIELDVFADGLVGLVIAEVEFDDLERAHAFTPPDWFGREVTDDPAWSNAALAVHGRPA